MTAELIQNQKSIGEKVKYSSFQPTEKQDTRMQITANIQMLVNAAFLLLLFIDKGE